MSVIGVVAASAGGLDTLRSGLVLPLLESHHQVAVTLTPTAATWLEHSGDIAALERDTQLSVRSDPRLPDQESPHPKVDLYVAAPLTANSVATLSLGLADNQALTVLCESIATVPMIVFPRIIAAHARQPAWPDHLDRLRRANVTLIYGDRVWPLAEPRAAGPRDIPEQAILAAVNDQLCRI